MNEYLDKFLSLLDADKYGVIKIFSIVFFVLLLDFIQKRVLKRFHNYLQATKTQWDDAFIHAVQKPLTFFIWIIGLSLVLDLIELPVTAELRIVGVIVTIAWVLVRFISFAEANILYQHKVAGKSLDRTTASAISQLLRMTILITATLVLLQSLGFNISAILAFGGIGGIAVGFAAKDLLANFFGGMMIYLDRPFAIGDWVRSTDRDIEGTVEKIGWRTTMIRTFDKRPLYVPNSVFANISVENPSRMSHRRIYETMGIRYDDINAMADIIDEVKAMLRAHPEIDQSQTMIVNFNSFAPSSLDFFIYTFTHTTDWIKYHEIKQDVLLKVSDIITAHQAEMAFPTSTLHIADEIKFNELPAK